MKKLHLISLLFAFFCLGLSCRGDVTNGDFQSWAGGNPTSWNCRIWGGSESNTWSADTTNYLFPGDIALKIQHNNTDTYTVAYQTITVSPHRYYTISCIAKVANIVPNTTGYSGEASLYLENQGKSYACTRIYRTCTSWKPTSLTFYSGDQTSFVLYCYLHRASGTAWFDKVTVTPVELINPSFELRNTDNTPQNWSGAIMYTNETGTYTCNPNITSDWTYSLQIKHALADTYSNVHQSYTVQPYTWYNVSCMAKTKCQKKDQYSDGASLFVTSAGGNQITFIPDDQPIWQEASVNVYSGSNTTITIYVRLHKASGLAFFDNIRVTQISYQNPCFEINDGTGKLLGWTMKNWGTTGAVSLDSAEKHDGSYAAKIYNTDPAQYTYIIQKCPMDREAYYKMTCWGKVQGISNNSASVSSTYYPPIYFNNTAWTPGEYHFFSNDNEIMEAYPKLYLSAGSFWIDGISIERESHPASLQLSGITLPAYVDDSTKRNLKVNNNVIFPIGFFNTKTTTQLGEIADAGFNMACINISDVTTAYLDYANSRNIKVIIELPFSDPTGLNSYKNHSAVIGWYFCDEPYLSRITPAQMFEKYNVIKSNDTNHFVTSSFCNAKDFEYHKHCLDVAQSDDNYFIKGSTENLGTVFDKALLAKYSILYDSNKTHFETLQAYTGGSLTLPTYDQFRAQIFLAITGDVKGIMFWVYDNCNGNGVSFKNAVSYWPSISTMNAEINLIQPIIQETTVQTNKKGDICYILKENADHTEQWLIAVNASASSISLNIEMGATSKNISSIIPSTGSFSYNSGTHFLSDTLLGYDVKVYKIQASSPTYGGEGGVWF